MRSIALALLATTLALTGLQAAPPKPGAFFNYVPAKSGKPVVYTVDGVTVRATAKTDPEDTEMLQPVFTFSAPGMKPFTMMGESSLGSYPHQVAIGRLNKGDARPSIILQSYSGGAHCCTRIDVAVPESGAYKIVSLGAWDGEGLEAFPKDISGDGVTDFRFVDNAFNYAFASYADSWAPPLIMNVLGGKAVDVTTKPAFRKLIAADMALARKHCTDTGKGIYRNGACAAYGADAAMLGRYPEARAEIVKFHQKVADWDYPTGCSVKETDTGCPEGKEVTYKTLPEALDAFLQREGYLK